MALTAAQIEEKITALQSALYSGQLRVRFGDRDITYRSVAEIREALRQAEAQLADANGTRVRVFRVESEKGLI